MVNWNCYTHWHNNNLMKVTLPFNVALTLVPVFVSPVSHQMAQVVISHYSSLCLHFSGGTSIFCWDKYTWINTCAIAQSAFWESCVLCVLNNETVVTHGSFSRSLSLASPRYSDSSWNRILMKIRLDEVVSSSFNRIILSTCVMGRPQHGGNSVQGEHT